MRTAFKVTQDVALCSILGTELVGDHGSRYLPLRLQQLAHQALFRLGISAALHQNVEDEAVLADGTPEPLLLAIDGHHAFVEMPFATPVLDTWKETSELPWFAFWAKKLLHRGTLDPFVAFALSQGIAQSRDHALTMKPGFLDWMEARNPKETDHEALFDQRSFLK